MVDFSKLTNTIPNPEDANPDEGEESIENFLDGVPDDILDAISDDESSPSDEGIPEWETLMEERSIENVLAKEEIFVTLQVRTGAVYKVVIVENPKVFTNKKGEKQYSMLVNYNGMIHQLYTPNSFLFWYTVLRRRANLKPSEMIGRKIVFQKTKQLGKDKKYYNMFSVQWSPE